MYIKIIIIIIIIIVVEVNFQTNIRFLKFYAY